jgi:hypothetical protein
MKTRLTFLLLLFICFSCGTGNKPASDAEKEKIKGEVKEAVTTIFKGCEEANFEMTMAPWLDTPDFVYVNNGMSFNYKQTLDAVKPIFASMINQKVTLKDEKYAILDGSTVIYTTNCTFLENYKDGHSILSDPTVMQITFRKTDGKWRAVNGVESSIRQNVKNEATAKELNQAELIRQFIGSWESDVAKDTSVSFGAMQYGTGIEGNYNYIVKGKISSEGKFLWGYDKKLDKIIAVESTKGAEISVYALWFISKTKYIEVPYSDLANPDYALYKWEAEFKTPGLCVETTTVNGKPVKTVNWVKVK